MEVEVDRKNPDRPLYVYCMSDCDRKDYDRLRKDESLRGIPIRIHWVDSILDLREFEGAYLRELQVLEIEF